MTSRYGGYDDREFVAEFYDAAYESMRQRDINFFVDYSRNSGGRTLELGCGTGRVLIPTAAAGYEITGLDLSLHMLKICREKLSRQPEEVQERIKLIQGNMTDFDTGETYSLVTTPFRPFQHLITVEEQKACLNCTSRHLVHGGLLILDLFHPRLQRLIPDSRYMSEIEDLPEMELPDGRRLRRTNRTAGYHREQQYNDIEIIYYVIYTDGRQERLVEAFPFRYFFRYEVEHLLELCGFRVVDIFGDYDRYPLSNDSPEMIFVAEKRD
jgi:SAM-dependent methyltransferase